MFSHLFAINLWVFCLLFFATPCPAKSPEGFLPLPEPKALPSLVLRNEKGEQKLLSELLREKAPQTRQIILHLWAPRCPPCIREMQALDAAWPALHASGVEVIALAQDPDGVITVPAFAQRQEIRHLPLYVDTERLVLKGLESPFLPISYILDEGSRVVALHKGPLDWAFIGRALDNQMEP